jgi:hypothetical protein
LLVYSEDLKYKNSSGKEWLIKKIKSISCDLLISI